MRGVFTYDPTSQTGLRWAIEIRCGFHNSVLKCSVGDVAGGASGTGHMEVTYQGISYYCHHIVWELFNGPIADGLFVDHIDGDGTNNRIENLRLVSHKVNMRNRRKGRNNTSGTTGVGLYEEGGWSFWRAKWNDLAGKERSKRFGVLKYGYDEAKRLAIEYREKKIKELNEQGAGYTARHGVDE